LSHILIIAAWYHPFFHPRAHRWTALAEHWAAQGHVVHVVTGRQKDYLKEETFRGVHVHRTGFDSLKEMFYFYLGSRQARGRVGNAQQPPGRFFRLLNWVYGTFWKRVCFPDEACIWYFPAKKRSLQLLEQEQFDAIVTVSMPFTAHLIGLAAKRRFPRLKWLADMGDPYAVQVRPNTFLYGRKSRTLEQRILENAGVVSVTTSRTRDKFRDVYGAASVRNMHVIPPLLHPASEFVLPQPGHPGTAIKIGYFGAFYAPFRTPDAFLNLLQRTFELHPSLHEQLEVHIYGDIFPEFYQALCAQPAIHLHGLRPRAEVRRAMADMNMLLHIGNTTAYQLPSKAVEYLASGRPVLHLAYTGNDAFIDFWGTAPGLLVLQVRMGQIDENDLRRWVEWLENGMSLMPFEQRKERINLYLIDSISNAYLRLLLA